MIIESGSEILFKTLQLYCLLFIGIVFAICSKKMKPASNQNKQQDDIVPEKKLKNQEKGKSTKLRRKKKVKKEKQKEKDNDEDVQIKLSIKEPEVRPDEFDDDEENPLAKIPIYPRAANTKKKESTSVTGNASKQGNNGTPSSSKTTSTASPGPGLSPTPLQESEAPLFAINEKQIGSSCYVRLD